jgi:hypothetical protein
MLARRHGARPFRADFRLGVAFRAAAMRRRGERRIGKSRHPRRVGRDQLGFARVPFRQQLRIGQTADQAGVDEARKTHAGNMA